jgi:Zn-dependent metalloprotease
MSQPSKYDQPEHMDDYEFMPVGPMTDWGGVHINSGIHNKAAYHLLTAKDVHRNPLFDPREVAALFYLALTQHLSRTSKFLDSRRGVELAARTFFRNDPRQQEKLAAIVDAFDKVGITTSLGVTFEPNNLSS